jgi:hypothetical protein
LQIQAEGNLSLSGLNPIVFPKYWMGLTTSNWPIFSWTDGKTPGPDVFNSASTLYRHWGSYMWVARLPVGRQPARERAWPLACGAGSCWQLALTAAALRRCAAGT